jgi:uncharacterized membrane protein AbrB (regulator of aidB expression)
VTPLIALNFIITIDEKAYSKSVGYTHGIRILLVAGLILVVREVFYAATMNNIAKQEEEKLFYPFSAGTELVVVLMFAIPGLVPPKQRLVAMTYQCKQPPDLAVEHSGLSDDSYLM